MRARDELPPFEPSYSVDEFCLSERMSAAYRSTRCGSRVKARASTMNGRCRRITHKARLEWQAAREAEACGGANEAA